MKKWLQKFLGINEIKNQITQNSLMSEVQLNQINNTLERILPKGKQKEIELIKSFELENNSCNLTFQLENDIVIDKSWTLVGTENKTANAFSQIAGGASTSSIVAYSTNGLYTATANVNNLMMYSNGSLSSITMKGSTFGNHAGFVGAGSSVFTPILAFQFASMLTGQYYFNGLTQQLNSVHKKIDQLVNLHHNERLAKLQFINSKISELGNRHYFSTEDFILVDKLKYDLSIIRYEYLLSIQQEILDLFMQENDSIQKKLIETPSDDITTTEKVKISFQKSQEKITTTISEKINSFFKDSVIEKGMLSLKKNSENSNKKVKKLSKKLNDSKFFFLSDIAIKSEKLYQLLKLLELKINLSDKSPNSNRIGKISELYSSVIEFDDNDSIFNQLENIKTSLKNNIINEIEIYRGNSSLNRTAIDSKGSEIRIKFNDLEKQLNKKNQILEDIERIKDGFEKPSKILIDNRDEITRVYSSPIT